MDLLHFNDQWRTQHKVYKKHDNALTNLFIKTSMSTILCDTQAFKEFSTALDLKLLVWNKRIKDVSEV